MDYLDDIVMNYMAVLGPFDNITDFELIDPETPFGNSLELAELYAVVWHFV